MRISAAALTFLVALCTHVLGARADTNQSTAEVLFAEGARSATGGEWAEAAERFEASLALEERAATHANLALAYHELRRPCDVLLHGEAIDALAVSDAQEGRAPVLARVRAAMEAAKREVAELSTEALPLSAILMIDNEHVRPVARHVYAMPGRHRLEIANGVVHEIVELTLVRGHVQPWPRAMARSSLAEHIAVPVAAPQAPASTPFVPAAAHTFSLRRSRSARSLGAVGLISQIAAISTFAWSVRAANRLDARDPAQPGYLDDYARYERTRVAVVPLGIGGGVLAATALALSPRLRVGGNRRVAWWSLAAAGLATATGVVLSVLTPARIGAEGSEAQTPIRFAGTFAFAVAIPLATFSAQQWLRSRGGHER